MDAIEKCIYWMEASVPVGGEESHKEIAAQATIDYANFRVALTAKDVELAEARKLLEQGTQHNIYGWTIRPSTTWYKAVEKFLHPAPVADEKEN